jgi:phasin family protein
MVGKNEQFSELNRKGMSAAMRMAQLSMENSQRIMALQSELAREMFQSGVENAQALAVAKDPQAIMQLRTRHAQETTQRMVTVAQQIAEISNHAREELARFVSEQLASGNQGMAESMQAFMKTLPAQTPNMMESFQQAVATATSAFENLSKASTAAMSGASKTAKKPAARAKRK